MFKLVNPLDKTEEYEINEEVKVFQTGKDAAIAASNIKIIFDKSYVVKPYVIPNDEWHPRERERFNDGTYRHVLPSLSKYCREEHFVHVSKEDPSLIAYTQSTYKGFLDIQTKSSIRGYLEKFASQVNRDEIMELEAEHSMEFAYSQLKWARTEDEIELVYTKYDPTIDGVNKSCMRYNTYSSSGRNDSFESQIHPCRVYAGDISVAYIINDKGETVARTLVYEKNKVYSRVYGNDNTANILHTIMKKLGYSKSVSYYEYKHDYESFLLLPDKETNSFYGARLQAIRLDKKLEKNFYGITSNKILRYVLPYFDEMQVASLMKDSNGNEYILMGYFPNHPDYINQIYSRETIGISFTSI